jgi:Cof subfamily protein (haloacid dehalogenase superfamily)
MKKYLLVLDLDGTLLQGYDHYDSKTFTYLKEINKDLVDIVIATGRPYRSSRFVYEKLELSTPLINYNGAFVHNPRLNQDPIFDYRIEAASLLALLRFCQKDLISAFCEVHDTIYWDGADSSIIPFLHKTDDATIYTGKLPTILNGNPNSSLFFFDSLAKAFTLVKEIQDNYPLLRSRIWDYQKYQIVEIYHHLVDKEIAIQKVQRDLGYTKENTIAIGDGINDVCLFRSAKTSVAMGNALDCVKKEAAFTTKRVEENGVYFFLTNFFKGENNDRGTK